MITDKDIAKLKTVFVTKGELETSLGRTEDRLVEMMTSVGDAIMKEVKMLKEDVNDILENYERRIEKLEQKLPASF